MSDGSWFFPKKKYWYSARVYPYRRVTNTAVPYTWVDETFSTFQKGSIIYTSHKKPFTAQSDQGGTMNLYRTGMESVRPLYLKANKYDGWVTCSTPPSWYHPPALVAPLSASNLVPFGATAVSRTIPTNPSFDLASFLGDSYSGGVPRTPGIELLRERSNLLKGGGDAYLNVEFGWLPLVSDLRDFARTVKNSRRLIDQFRKDSDRVIRRRYTDPPLEQTSTSSGFWFMGFTSGLSGDYTITREDFRHRWFSGAFKYHIPIGDSQWEKFLRAESLANHLLGTRLTPDAVWEAAPWSWAIDWFTNTGDVINNITRLGADGLVMLYGYAMEHRRLADHYVATGTSIPAGATFPYGRTCSQTEVQEWKTRIKANPYGFGVDDTSLTNVQLAILAALGLSKGLR